MVADVFLACKLMKVIPDPVVQFSLMKVLSQKEIQKYESFTTLDGYHKDLYCYVRKICDFSLGSIYEICYENSIRVPVLRRESEDGPPRPEYVYDEIKIADKIFLVYYTQPPVSNFIGILSGENNARKIASILSKLVNSDLSKSVRCFSEIKFLIKNNENAIRQIPDFLDVTEVHIEKIPDIYIDTLYMKGTMLDQSEEYQKFVESLGGELKVLAVKFKDRIYYIYETGKIFTKQANLASTERYIDETSLIYELMKLLHGAKCFT